MGAWPFVLATVFYVAQVGLELTISLSQSSRITDKLQLGLTRALGGLQPDHNRPPHSGCVSAEGHILWTYGQG